MYPGKFVHCNRIPVRVRHPLHIGTSRSVERGASRPAELQTGGEATCRLEVMDMSLNGCAAFPAGHVPHFGQGCARISKTAKHHFFSLANRFPAGSFLVGHL